MINMTEFTEMNLKPELVEALRRIGFTQTTEVQTAAIPEMLAGKNMVVRAKTGSGKTGAFMIPIVQKIKGSHHLDALVLVPTRELALQVEKFAASFCAPLGIRTVTVYGGASINMQMQAIDRGVNVVVGTPGRIIDLLERRALDIGEIKYMVLDEADQMLDMGFIEDVEYIMQRAPPDKQLVMFSATMPKEIMHLADRYTDNNNVKIRIGEEEDITVNTIQHFYTYAPGKMKFSALLAYIDEYKPKKAIIFARTKHDADVIHKVLVKSNHNAILLHGGLTQAKRERSLHHFREGAQFMIATNVAARGLDIADVTDIINFGTPDAPNVYVHRVGRSARMGKEGRAFTIAENYEREQIKDIQFYANVKLNQITLNLDKFRDVQLPSREEMYRDREPNRSGGGGRGMRPRGRRFSGGGGERGGQHHGGGEHRGSGEHRGGEHHGGGGGHRSGGGFRGGRGRRGGFGPRQHDRNF